MPAGVDGDARTVSSSRSTGCAPSMGVTFDQLSVNRNAPPAFWVTSLGFDTVRTVSSSPIAVFTRA